MTTHDLPVTVGYVKLISVGSAGRVTVDGGGGGGGGAAFTVSAADDVTPSTMATMLALPALLPVTLLVDVVLELTDATAEPAATDQVTARPLIVAPAESRATAVANDAPPTTMVAGLRVTCTEVTTAACASTVNDALPLFPSLWAEMVADPAATPLTYPACVTVATAVLDELQATTRPLNTFEAESRRTTLPCVPCPAATLLELSVTDTVATGADEFTAVIVKASMALRPSLVALNVVVPAPMARTSPEVETDATLLLGELNDTVRPVSTVPAESRSTTTSLVESPTTSEVVGALSDTVATGAGADA